MLFRKHLTINGTTIQIFEEENGAYIIQYQMDKQPKERRRYPGIEELCLALEKFIPRSEIMKGL